MPKLLCCLISVYFSCTADPQLGCHGHFSGIKLAGTVCFTNLMHSLPSVTYFGVHDFNSSKLSASSLLTKRRATASQPSCRFHFKAPRTRALEMEHKAAGATA